MSRMGRKMQIEKKRFKFKLLSFRNRIVDKSEKREQEGNLRGPSRQPGFGQPNISSIMRSI
jgi:hypothetical protein